MKDYLVILAGSPRGGKITWKSLHNYVLEPLNADLAICLSDKWTVSNEVLSGAKYKWIFKDYSKNLDYYSQYFSGNWREYLYTGKDTGLLSSGGVHFVFKDYILRNHLDTVKNYEFIIYSRFDQYYTDFHPRGVKDKILIPEGEDYFGVCDRHALVPKNMIEKFLGICKYIDSPSSMRNIPKFNNCETTFMRHLENVNLLSKVVRYKRSQFTSSLKGEHTNWRVAKYRIYLRNQLMTKYPDEFIKSINNLIKKRGLLNALMKETILVLNYIYLKTKVNLGKLKNKK